MGLVKHLAKLRIGVQDKFNVRAIQEYLDNTANAVNELLRQPILHGRFIKDIAVTDSERVTIKTGLGRRYQGYFIANSDGNITDMETHSDNPRKETELHITVKGTATTISVWVF